MDLSPSFKAYDVRGLVGVSITAESAEAVGAAFVDVLGLSGQTIACGGDMRPSSPEFSRAFAAGAARRGADVKSLGLISTDELYYACGALDMAGAIFTASHNPAEYNGIKMAKAGAVPVSSETGLNGHPGPGPAVPRRRDPRSRGRGHRDPRLDVLDGLRRKAPLAGAPGCRPAAEGGGGCRQRHGGPDRSRGPRGPVPPGAAAHCCPAVLRTRRHVPEPPCQPAGAGEPPRPAGRRRRPRCRHRTGVRRRRRPLLCGGRERKARDAVGHYGTGRRPRDPPRPGRRGSRARHHPQPDHLPRGAGNGCRTPADGRSGPAWGIPSSRP